MIGTAATIAYGDRLAWIGMVIVAEAYRGQGIGGLLLKGACDLLDRRKVACIKLDATPAGEPLYARHGFVRERALERWELNGPAAVANRGEAEPISDAVIGLDSVLFGADRQALAASLKRDWPEAAIEVREAGEVRGYALGRRGSRADHMGPWMARDEHAAARLLDAFLDRSARGRVFIDCVVDHPFARRLLAARGFRCSARCRIRAASARRWTTATCSRFSARVG